MPRPVLKQFTAIFVTFVCLDEVGHFPDFPIFPKDKNS